MHILHLLSSTDFHGSESMVAVLAKRLAASGDRCTVGLLEDAGAEHGNAWRGLLQHGLTPVTFECRGRFDSSLSRRLAGYAVSEGVDVIHSHKYKTTFYALLARRQSRVRRLPLVVTYHNWLFSSGALALYAVLDKRLARFCDAAVGVSPQIAHELQRHAPASRVHFVPNGIDCTTFRPGPGSSAMRRQLGLPDRPTLGFVGRLTAGKGVNFLIDAAESLPADQDFQLLIVGDGDHAAALRARAAGSPLQSRILMPGTRSDTPQLYQAMDVMVLPSLQEAFPMVVLEAMATEVPVIATDVGAVSQELGGESAGWVVPPGAAAPLAQALSAALGDPDERARRGRCGRRRVEELFSSAHMADTYHALYDSVSARCSVRAST